MKNKSTSSYSDKFSANQMRGHRTGHGNPDNNHSARVGSSAPKQKGRSRLALDGLQGLSTGTKVPMEMFQPDYSKKTDDITHQVGTVDANGIKRGTKGALKGKQKQLFGL
jgi:hypothetical protein